MSTASPPAQPPATIRPQELKVVSHTGLFYWWPVWAVGFLMAALTAWDGHRMALVPKDTQAERQRQVQGFEGPRDVLVTPPPPAHLPVVEPGKPDSPPLQPTLLMARSKGYGVIFTIVLLLVIVITNIPLRGLWSVIVLILIVLLAVVFAWLELWGKIIEYIFVLDVHINFLGYLSIALFLLAVWLITFIFFDRQIYMIFSPGGMRVRQEIGGAETAYDTRGMVVEKQRNDLFRHWILGLGSGDLIVRTSGAQVHTFDLPNVLFIGHKVKLIEEMLRQTGDVRD